MGGWKPNGLSSTISLIVSAALPVMDPEDAVIVVVPADTADVSPVLSTVATAEFDEVHVADDVRSFVLLSEYVPFAVNCWVLSSESFSAAGAIDSDTSEGEAPLLPFLLPLSVLLLMHASSEPNKSVTTINFNFMVASPDPKLKISKYKM